MSEPTQIFIRRGVLLTWLEELGIARWKTESLITGGVIKGELLPLHVNGSSQGKVNAKKKKKGGKPGPRLHFRVSQVKKALEL